MFFFYVYPVPTSVIILPLRGQETLISAQKVNPADIVKPPPDFVFVVVQILTGNILEVSVWESVGSSSSIVTFD